MQSRGGKVDMNKQMKGSAIKYGDNINTDVIIPTMFCNTTDIEFLGNHCLYNLDREFINKRKEGDILVVGENFGCGSSRENAPLAIKGAKISCVIAKSFARIFFRNAINIGLPVIESEELVDAIEEGDEIEIDFESSVCRNMTKGTEYSINKYQDIILEVFKEGGLINFAKNRGGVL